MAFKKGKKKTGGRKVGVTNKLPQDLKVAINNLLERNASQMDTWLDRVAKRSPYKALELMYKFSEFAIPKLSRSEANTNIKMAVLKAEVSVITSPVKIATNEKDIKE